jgi:LCP family protein required for cell wall assembly
MAPGDEERPDRPEYNVYRAGSGRGRGGNRRKKDEPASSKGDAPKRRERGGEPDGAPDYTVYRSRRSPLARLREGGGAEALKRIGSGRRKQRRAEVESEQRRRLTGERPTWRRVLKWALIGAGLWVLLSGVLFVVSAQIQKGKLNDAAADEVGAFPLLAISPQTILVIGTDMRPADNQEPGAETTRRCVRRAAQGDPPGASCVPARADTLMLVRAGGGKFEKLSIPRDTLAEIPGQGPQKINAAYAFGGAALQIRTVEELLGIGIDHVVIVDFEGFEELIDALGGVKVRLTERFKSKVGGGAGQGGITLELDRGEHTLDGQNALVYARTRVNLRDDSENDLDRARRQQQVLSGVKDRLTSITRLPYNFIKGPFIAWNAPKAMVTDMGGLTLPQLAFAAAIGGEPGDTILGQRSATESGGNIVIPEQECRRAVRRLLGGPGPEDPACSPAAEPSTVVPVPETVTPAPAPVIP